MMCKKILILSMLTVLFSINAVFANADFRQRSSKNYMQNYHYTSTNAIYESNRYQDHYYHRYNPNNDFARNMYMISKMAEKNPGVKYKYTSISAVYL